MKSKIEKRNITLKATKIRSKYAEEKLTSTAENKTVKTCVNLLTLSRR